ACLWIVSERLFLRIIGHVEPKEIRSRRRAWVRDQCCIRDGVVSDETHDCVSLAEQLHQVSLEDHTYGRPQALSMLTYTKLLTDPAMAAVSSHQKLGANRACAGAFPLADRGHDA